MYDGRSVRRHGVGTDLTSYTPANMDRRACRSCQLSSIGATDRQVEEDLTNSSCHDCETCHHITIKLGDQNGLIVQDLISKDKL